MKIQSKNIWLILSVLTACELGIIGSGQAQEQTTERRRANDELVDPNQQSSPFGRSQSVQEQAKITARAVAGIRPRKNFSDTIRQAAEAVRDAEGEEAKATANKKLSELLSQYFDQDMVQREQELAQIEERLVKLRELLDRRRLKKQEILELQTKVALNEADGLGFYDSERSGGGKGAATSGVGGGGGGSLFGRAFQVDREVPEIIEVPVPTVVPLTDNPFAFPTVTPGSPSVPDPQPTPTK